MSQIVKINPNYTTRIQSIMYASPMASVYNGVVQFFEEGNSSMDEIGLNGAIIFTAVNTLSVNDVIWYRNENDDLQSATITSLQISEEGSSKSYYITSTRQTTSNQLETSFYSYCKPSQIPVTFSARMFITNTPTEICILSFVGDIQAGDVINYEDVDVGSGQFTVLDIPWRLVVGAPFNEKLLLTIDTPIAFSEQLSSSFYKIGAQEYEILTAPRSALKAIKRM